MTHENARELERQVEAKIRGMLLDGEPEKAEEYLDRMYENVSYLYSYFSVATFGRLDELIMDYKVQAGLVEDL